MILNEVYMKRTKLLSTSILLSLLGAVTVNAATADSVFDLGEYVVRASDKDKILQGGFSRNDASFALLGERSAMDIPFTTTVIGPKAVDQFSSPNMPLDAVLSNDPAIRRAGSTVHNDFTYRGFRANGTSSLVNGIPGLMTQFNAPTYMMDRIELLNGPAGGFTGSAVQYESDASGGIVNYSTKKAGDTPRRIFKQTFTGQNNFGEYIDISHRLGKDNEWGVRVNAEYLHGNTAIDGEKHNAASTYINVDRQGDTSTFNFFGGYSDREVHNGARWFKLGKGINTLPVAPKGSNNYGFDGMYKSSYGYIASINYSKKLNDHVSVFTNLGLNHNNLDNNVMPQFSAYTLKDINGNYDVNYQIGGTPQNTYFAQVGTNLKYETGKVKHDIKIAIDKSWKNRDTGYVSGYPAPAAPTATFGNLGKANLYTGLVQTSQPITQFKTGKKAKDTMYGWSFLDSMSFDKWDVLVGVHQHTSKTTAYNEKTNAAISTVSAKATSPTFAVTYKPNENVSVYASHSEYFNSGRVVPSGKENKGEILPPAKAKQNEIGVKYQNHGFLTSFALFDIKQAINIDRIINDKIFMVQDGLDHHRGAEWQFNGRLSDKWSTFGGVMYMNATKERTNKGLQDGWRVSAQPLWSGVLGLEYAANDKTTFVGRMTYFGNSIIRNASPTVEGVNVPSYTVFDFGARYKTNINNHPATFSVMLYNALNRNYWMASRGDQVYVSSPRTLTVSAQFDF